MSEGTNHFISEQGAEMDRPSTLHLLVDRAGGEVTRVRVGGQVVPVVEGTVRF